MDTTNTLDAGASPFNPQSFHIGLKFHEDKIIKCKINSKMRIDNDYNN
jgi:hypothetical protein